MDWRALIFTVLAFVVFPVWAYILARLVTRAITRTLGEWKNKNKEEQNESSRQDRQ